MIYLTQFKDYNHAIKMHRRFVRMENWKDNSEAIKMQIRNFN